MPFRRLIHALICFKAHKTKQKVNNIIKSFFAKVQIHFNEKKTCFPSRPCDKDGLRSAAKFTI